MELFSYLFFNLDIELLTLSATVYIYQKDMTKDTGD